MSDEKENMQEQFFTTLCKNKTPTTIFLVNGVKLQGVVTWHDKHAIMLRREAHAQLIYKHAVATVMPNSPMTTAELTELSETDAA